jgi:formamidopyrimidine-DNA glycosylase
LRFVLSEKELNEKLDSLGADLMDDSTTEDVFLQIMDKSVQSRNICKFLMDQGKIAGVG